ncbi:ATP-binding protein [Candidatus Saganbacteria bacterium]|nr:ATP-binding protein [Candidatus Saganbacteria bacterium]
MFKREQKLLNLGKESCFLWGPRQTGKSTLLDKLFPDSLRYDLLLTKEYVRLSANPGLFHDELLQKHSLKNPVIIDEVQKIPALLDEIQWLIVNREIQFILCGSSARKLKRGAGNLLGGRALRYELHPLVYKEIPKFNLLRALTNGLLPRHYLAANPQPLLQAYIGDYLKEEIAAEAITRNIPAFARFLNAAAFSNGQTINYQNVARECYVNAVTVKEYFQILIDTLIGYYLPAFQKRPKRRVIHAPRFYFSDIGIANYLLKRGTIEYNSENFGRAFEQFIFQELLAYSHYSGKNFDLAYWRTASQLEVDFILGDHEAAIEVKASKNVGPQHCHGLRAFDEEYKTKYSIVVSLDPRPRLVDKLHILPWEDFLEKLWSGKII